MQTLQRFDKADYIAYLCYNNHLLFSMEQNKILIYQTDDGHTQIEVRLENDTVWLIYLSPLEQTSLNTFKIYTMMEN